MKLKLCLILLTIICAHKAHSQNDLMNATFYLSNGKKLDGRIDKNFVTKTGSVKVHVGNNKRISQSLRKVDSIKANNEIYYIVKPDFLTTEIHRKITSGTLSLYEVNGKFLKIKRNESELYLVPQSKYARTYEVFCADTVTRQSKDLRKAEFIPLIKACNETESSGDEYVPYDSLKKSSQRLILRLSFLRPEAGLEVKLHNNISVYNSIGMNVLGDQFRNAQTFINYDYTGQLRFYYNSKRRLEKGKSNYNFSGPYLAPTYKHFIEINRQNRNVVGATIGLQNNSFLNSTYSGLSGGIGLEPSSGALFIFTSLAMGFAF